jgi:hypothetical protein
MACIARSRRLSAPGGEIYAFVGVAAGGRAAAGQLGQDGQRLSHRRKKSELAAVHQPAVLGLVQLPSLGQPCVVEQTALGDLQRRATNVVPVPITGLAPARVRRRTIFHGLINKYAHVA